METFTPISAGVGGILIGPLWLSDRTHRSRCPGGDRHHSARPRSRGPRKPGWIGGAVLFGIGEGLIGYCSGPALAALGFGDWRTLLFTAAMLVGIGGFQVLHRASIVRTAAPDHAEGIVRLCNRSRLPLGNQE